MKHHDEKAFAQCINDTKELYKELCITSTFENDEERNDFLVAWAETMTESEKKLVQQEIDNASCVKHLESCSGVGCDVCVTKLFEDKDGVCGLLLSKIVACYCILTYADKKIDELTQKQKQKNQKNDALICELSINDVVVDKNGKEYTIDKITVSKDYGTSYQCKPHRVFIENDIKNNIIHKKESEEL